MPSGAAFDQESVALAPQLIAAARAATAKRERLDALHQELESAKSEIGLAAEACNSINADVEPANIAAVYNAFFRLAREYGLKGTWDVIDHRRTCHNNRDRNRTGAETEADYAVAKDLVEQGLRGALPESVIRQICDDAHLRPALRTLGILVRVLGEKYRLDALPCPAGEALGIARWLRDFFAGPEPTSLAMFEFERRKRRLGEALAELHIDDVPACPDLRHDTRERQLQVMDMVIERLHAATSRQSPDVLGAASTEIPPPQQSQDAQGAALMAPPTLTRPSDPLERLRGISTASASQIAEMLGQSLRNRVEPLLRKLRDDKPACYFEVEADAKRATDPKYFYRVPEILGDLETALLRWAATDRRRP